MTPLLPEPRERMRRFFDASATRRARFVERRHAYYDDLHAWLNLRLPEDASLIEIGCGIGNVLERLPQKKKTGIDFSEAMIAQARNRDQSGTQYLVDDAENMAHRGAYDAVLLLDTISTLWDVQKSLEEIRAKLCRPGTKLFITYHNFLWKPLLALAAFLGMKTPLPEQNWLSPQDVHTLLRLSGFEVIADGQRFLWPWATPLIAPFFNRFVCKLPVLRHFSLVHFTVARPVTSGRKSSPSVSIVVPVRNEAGNIPRVLKEIPPFASSIELLFVEGHSTDGTWEAVQTEMKNYTGPFAVRALRQTGRGKGDAVRAGFHEATGDILMILDGDLTVAPGELPKFYEVIVNDRGEFLNGSRMVYPMENTAMRFLNILGNKGFSVLFSGLLGQPIKDTLCGTKVLWRQDARHIAAGRAAFGGDPFGDFDLLFGAARLYLKIVEIPVHYGARTYGRTNIRRFRDGFLLLKMCLRFASRLTFR